jgi:hypothetical protein
MTRLLVAIVLFAGCSRPDAPPQCAAQNGEERAVCLHVAAGRLRVHATSLRKEGFTGEAERLASLAASLDSEVHAILGGNE